MHLRNSWGIYIALLFGTFITIEAAAFQAPALPSVTRHFGIPVSLAALILMFYFIALTVFAPIMGRFGDQYGRKKVLSAGLFIFALSEFAAAWAPNFGVFLTARFAQGFGVACILPGVFAYATHLFPEHKRGLALGVLTFTMTFGAASGGLLGGLLIDRLGWPSVYWISGALALAGLLPVRLLVSEIKSVRQPAAFDYSGALLLFVTIAALLSFPTWASNFGRASPLTWIIAGVGLVSVILLWRHSGRVSAPVIDVDILSRRAFALPSAIYWLHALFFSGVIYSLAFFVNNRPGGSASQFGFVTLFLYGSAMLSSPIAGRLIDRFGPRTISVVALTVSLAALLMFIAIDVATPLWTIILVVCMLGLAIGANGPATMKMAFNAVPPPKMGAGTGLFSMFRDLGAPTGSSLALAVFGVTLAYQAKASLSRLTAGYGFDASLLEQLASAAAGRAQALPTELAARLAASGVEAQTLVRQAGVEALDGALANVGYLLASMNALALLLSLRLAKAATGRGAALDAAPVAADDGGAR
ncbi:MAG TPA: MFS transporter [Steroidobacter sp.]|jgi:MFS family permease|nr:MFS transporter [Steroidobacteraceae bacterium]HLS83013.1 MFS transporter [Steroidobacter sp.]